MRVYDIVNAGPRHRFLIRNKQGQPLLVSNCSQAVAADLMSHGAREAEKRWMGPFALIHDQGLALRRGDQTAKDFADALASKPDWALDLPLKVEAKIVPFYSK